MDNSNLFNAEDYSLSFSDEVTTEEKIQCVFSDTQSHEMKAYAANVLIGNVPAKKLSDGVGDEFMLCGFHFKTFRFKDSDDNRADRHGRFITLFGLKEGSPCAYVTTSDKVYEALTKIIVVYGEPAKWKSDVPVRIRMNALENGKAYSLEVIG